MRFLLNIAAILALLSLLACGDKKKSDLELFEEGPVRVTLSVDPATGIQPLYVSFSAYIERKDEVVSDTITKIRWVIRDPNGNEREVVQDSYNYQDKEANEENFFYLDYQFLQPGIFKVRLELNDGQYRSRFVNVRVIENPRLRR